MLVSPVILLLPESCLCRVEKGLSEGGLVELFAVL
jgi:hypothetical protein